MLLCLISAPRYRPQRPTRSRPPMLHHSRPSRIRQNWDEFLKVVHLVHASPALLITLYSAWQDRRNPRHQISGTRVRASSAFHGSESIVRLTLTNPKLGHSVTFHSHHSPIPLAVPCPRSLWHGLTIEQLCHKAGGCSSRAFHVLMERQNIGQLQPTAGAEGRQLKPMAWT